MIKRVYPGATASCVNHYVTATITEDKPEKVVICAGTNNLTKKERTPRDTVNEIMDIVETCKKGGIKQIFVSSLICRPEFQKEVDEMNKLLKYYAGIYGFVFIDNSDIHDEHLWRDKVHLNNKDINLLATNYISYLNKPSYLPFENIWS